MHYFKIVLVAAFGLAANLTHAQGALEPTAPPAPVMKTLDQVEPRTPISSFGTISTSGSYYLTDDITGRLTIAANDVDLDLQGFTITGGSTVTLEIPSVDNVRVHNGTIRGSTSVSIGVSNSSNIVLENLRVLDGTNNAVQIVDHSGLIVVRSTLVDSTGSGGINIFNNVDRAMDAVIEGNVVRNAGAGIVINQNGTEGLTASVAGNRVVNSLGNGISVAAGGGGPTSGAISDNTVYGSGSIGLAVSGNFIVTQNLAQANGSNYNLASAPNAAAVSALATAGPWDNVEQ